MTSLHPTAPARHRRPTPTMRIAVLGTRGLPAADDGLETAVEEIGQRLVGLGHDVTVYGRSTERNAPRDHLGMRLVQLPAIGSKSLETLSHTALSTAHFTASARHDVAFVFNTANAFFVPMLRARAGAVAVHVGSPDEKRETRGRWGRRWDRMAEQVAVREADALIADAQGTADYYDDEFGIPTELIGYGTRILRNTPTDAIEALGLVPGQFHLAVARLEPENRVDVIVEGYTRSASRLPLVVVGCAPYSAAYAEGIARVAGADPRILMLGGVSDQRLLDQLYAHALCSVHGHSAGATSPALLKAMGAGTAVLGWDAPVNRAVAGTAGLYFRSAEQLAAQFGEVERYGFRFHDIGELMQERARANHDWDAVTEAYESLAAKLTRGYSTRGLSSGRRHDSEWIDVPAALEA